MVQLVECRLHTGITDAQLLQRAEFLHLERPTDAPFPGFWWAASRRFTKTQTQEECLSVFCRHNPCTKLSIKAFKGHTLKDENKSYSRLCSIPSGTLRPHTQQLRHASYNFLKTIAVDAVSSDLGGQGYFLAKNLNDLTALETNLFQLFVCILQAWRHEGEALSYVKLWRKETFHATKLFKLTSHLYSGI